MSRLTKKDYKNWVKGIGYCNKKQAERVTQIMHKLGKFEDLEEELGCPLEVVFKALKDGVHIEVEHLPDIIERPRLYYSDDFKCYCLEMLYGEYVVKLQDYKKTWWLKGEKNE